MSVPIAKNVCSCRWFRSHPSLPRESLWNQQKLPTWVCLKTGLLQKLMVYFTILSPFKLPLQIFQTSIIFNFPDECPSQRKRKPAWAARRSDSKLISAPFPASEVRSNRHSVRLDSARQTEPSRDHWDHWEIEWNSHWMMKYDEMIES